MKVTIDFETRSACDLKQHGAVVYSEHPTTEALCMAVKYHGQPPGYLLPRSPTATGLEVINYLAYSDDIDIIEAHNASFEHLIWNNVCMPKYKWPPIPFYKLRCSAAKAAMHSLPRSLEGACNALNLPVRKDTEGYRLMMKLCRPRRINNADRKEWLESGECIELDNYFYYSESDSRIYLWHEDPADLERLYQYCMNDTIAEEALSDRLPDLPEKELAIWQLDQIINNRGILVDIESAKRMIQMVNEHEAILLEELSKLTYGKVKTAKQVEQLRKHLLGLGLDIPDLLAATVKDYLKREDLTPETRRILEIRQSLGRSSSAKYTAILDRVSVDSRVRQSMLYHGAGTGRWSGAGIQPHNFPSRIKVSDELEVLLKCINSGGLNLLKALYEDDPMAVAGAVTRSMLMAGPGRILNVADYSAIEGRGLAWLAGEEDELENYRNDRDPYIANAAMILRKTYDEITKDERQSPGKISVLACGYGGSVNAVRKFGGEGMTDDEIRKRIVIPWRNAHPATVAFWSLLEMACFDAVNNPGRVYGARSINFRVKNGFLMCRLSSGRVLYYYDPRVISATFYTLRNGNYVRATPGVPEEDILSVQERPQVSYMTVDGVTKKWIRTTTYGGKLAENVTQAICRDIMAEAMIRVEKAGYNLVLTVHDELVSETAETFGTVEEYERLLCEVPSWAKGFPIKASGWRGKRYKK